MNDRQNIESQGMDLAKGLPMFAASEPEVLTQEKEQLAELDKKGILGRWKGYWAKTGPGWMQSAMTLGGGSAMASLFAGAFMQYKLLWVQPFAMLLGIIMLSALAHQTMSTGQRPFYAMKKYLHPSMAWAWAISTLVATVIWHFPQYALAAGMTEDVINAVTGFKTTEKTQTIFLLFLGLIFFAVGTTVSWNYGSGRKGIKHFEKFIKTVIWLIILCFGIVVVKKSIDGGIVWGNVFRGFIPSLPKDTKGVEIMIAGFSAAVGINMTFLFGYSYLARGWGAEHRGLAKFDLITGMLIPYTLATSLMVIVAGCTIYNPDGATNISPVQAARMFEASGLPMVFSRLIFGFGIIGMAMNCITLHMLTCGFAACEIFGIEPGGWKYKLACLTPAPGFLGVVLWKHMGPWIAIPTSAVCLLMLPIAYIGFFILNNNKEYLGENKPAGCRAFVWNIAMLFAIAVSVFSGIYLLYKSIIPKLMQIFGG